jgi:hypothetical protein
VSAKGVNFAGHSLGLEKIKARFSLRSAASTTVRRIEEVEVGGGKRRWRDEVEGRGRETRWKEETDGKRGPKMRAKKLGQKA